MSISSSRHDIFVRSNSSLGMHQALHCKLGRVEPAYIECGNGAAAMQVSQVNLVELGPIKLGHSTVPTLKRSWFNFSGFTVRMVVESQSASK